MALRFLLMYNGVSLYDLRPIDVTLELDACLTGLGGQSGSFTSHCEGLHELAYCSLGEYLACCEIIQASMGVKEGPDTL